MSNIYDDPQDFMLQAVGEIQWGEACYDFDLTVVWKRDIDGALVFAEDSGCSCPAPFESLKLTDLRMATPLAEFQKHLEFRDRGANQASDIAELLERMHKAGAR